MAESSPIVPWRFRDQVQLLAVVLPLTGFYSGPEEIPGRLAQIRRRWTRTLRRLRTLGWPPALRSYRTARNCPPSGILQYQVPRPCRLVTACPFCWARQTAVWWARIDAAFFQNPAPELPALSADARAGRAIELDQEPSAVPVVLSGPAIRARGLTLVTRFRSYPIHPWLQLPEKRVDLLRDFYQARVTGRARYFRDAEPWFCRSQEISALMAPLRRAGQAVGCFENLTVHLTRHQDRWQVAIRQVWLVPEGQAISICHPQEDVTLTERIIPNPWRSQVMRAVAQACRYPQALLSPSQEGRPALQLVTARQDLRLAAMYGVFRGVRP